MTQLGGWPLAQMWTAVSSALAEQHLAADAVVAYVDGELSLAADERATRHLAECPLCTAEVAAQRQARAAVRSATTPMMPATLLAALHAIPQSVELPPRPGELSVDENGEFVVAQRPLDDRPPIDDRAPLGLSAPLGSSDRIGSTAPLGAAALGAHVSSPGHVSSPARSRRRVRQGAGVVMSGLVLGALALASPVVEPTVAGVPRPGAESGDSQPVTAVPARFELGSRVGERQTDEQTLVAGLPQR
jgi:anti-sigma factor RsiW